MPAEFKLFGSLASPYSLKMLAALRYRRIAHLLLTDPGEIGAALGQVKVPVIPVLQYPDGKYSNDTTPLIFDLERRFKRRRIVPKSPALGFIACLIEDMADEWCTKIMFEYRWRRLLDQDALAQQLAIDMAPLATSTDLSKRQQSLRQRQVDRMALVGATPGNQPLLEASFVQLLDILETIVAQQAYLFGARPSLADFALYGQFAQLANDPTPGAILRERAPRFARWLARLADASGVEGSWAQSTGDVLALLTPLLRFCAEIYLPFLDANTKAVATDAPVMHVELNGQPYQQAPYRYQSRCFIALRERYAELSASDKAELEPVLDRIGALRFITQRARV
ncbi:MAG: glutathione S-transferase C-terminal domain-containing protein [Pseudomonadota bacterium]